MSDRPNLSKVQIARAHQALQAHMNVVLQEKGYGIFRSNHETLGIVTEEYNEFVLALHAGLDMSHVRAELLDIAQCALFGVACIDSGEMDW